MAKTIAELLVDLFETGCFIKMEGEAILINTGKQLVKILFDQEGDHLTIGTTTLDLKQYNYQVAEGLPRGFVCLTPY